MMYMVTAQSTVLQCRSCTGPSGPRSRCVYKSVGSVYVPRSFFDVSHTGICSPYRGYSIQEGFWSQTDRWRFKHLLALYRLAIKSVSTLVSPCVNGTDIAMRSKGGDVWSQCPPRKRCLIQVAVMAVTPTTSLMRIPFPVCQDTPFCPGVPPPGSLPCLIHQGTPTVSPKNLVPGHFLFQV